MADDSKIFNPKSGNQVSAKWAEGQGIIDEDGNYLDDDGQPAALIELVDPDEDLGDDFLRDKADEAKEVAAAVFGEADSGAEAAEQDVEDSEPAAEDDYEEVLSERGELRARVADLEEDYETVVDQKRQLHAKISELEAELEEAERRANQYQSRKEAAEVRLAQEKQKARRVRRHNDELEDENARLEEQVNPTQKRTRHDQDGGISIKR
jgi:chromosome segregation ATPase